MRGESWIFRAKLSSGCRLSTPAYKRQEREDGVRFPSSLVTKSKVEIREGTLRAVSVVTAGVTNRSVGGRNISRRICIGPCTI